MRLGILSDTHDKLDRTITALEILQQAGAEALIHCGDLTGPDIVFACGILPFTFVFGNNEEDFADLRRACRQVNGACLEMGGEITVAGKRIAVTHGHLMREVRALEAQQPDYLLYGHSHVAADDRHGSIRRINPGALHRAERYSVAILDVERDQLRFLPVPK